MLDEEWDGSHPVIFGGDFNMKEARDRLDYVTRDNRSVKRPAFIVHQYCKNVASDCDIRISFDGDEPWLDTNDWQGWLPTNRSEIRPIMVDAMFDEPHPLAPEIKKRKTLSDHDGLLVRYRLTWHPDDFK